MNKQLLIIPFILSLAYGTSSLVQASLSESIVVGNAAYKIGQYAYDSVFNTEENKEIIKKHLPADSYIAQGCDKDLSQACIILATHYRNLEEYHKINTLEGELSKINNPELKEVIQHSITEAAKDKIKMNLPDDTTTYWKSLPTSTQAELKNVFQEIIEENVYGIDNYAQELTYLYESLNK
ncbi:MAG TPA: hypothetical protein VHX42_05080 [Candidatus Babeliales bacterium]|jgi:hypothetical protein|nr:hypothetical protein [Candidatus Babeliales bacterium]